MFMGGISGRLGPHFVSLTLSSSSSYSLVLVEGGHSGDTRGKLYHIVFIFILV